MTRDTGHLWSWVGACAPLVALAAVPVQATAATYHFDLPKQNLADAIGRYGIVANVQVLYDPNLVLGKQSHAVRGFLSREQAVREMLAGTDLAYRFTDNVLLIFARASAAEGFRPPPDRPAAEPTVVTVTALKQQLMSSVVRKRNADHLVETVAADDIGKFPDSNLAESLQRLPGISISRSHGEGYQVSVRGFGPEFNTVLMDGDLMPSRNAGREFNFNDLSSDFINSVEVYKSPPLNMPSGGIGATIDINGSKPFDFSDNMRELTLAATVDSGMDDKVQPVVGALVSQRFMDGRFGILASLSRQSYVSHENSVSIAAWKRDTSYLPGVIDDSLDTGGHIYTPQNWMMGMQTVRRTRINGRLVVQVRPDDALDLDLHLQYADLRDQLNGAFLGVWFTTNDPTTAAVTTNANGTVVNYYQLNALDLDAEDDVTRTRDLVDGLNIRWRATPTLAFTASADTARSVQNPGGEREHNESDVGFANQTQFVLGRTPHDLPYILRYDERLPNRVQNGGPPGNGDSYLDPSNMRPHILTRASDNTHDVINQIKLRSEWTPADIRLRLGADFITRTKDVRAVNDDSVYCVYCGYPAYPDLPDGLFTKRVHVPADFINGFANGALLPPQLLSYDVNAVADIYERASGVSLAPVPTAASYKVRESTSAGFFEARLTGRVLGRPLTFVGGARFETSKVLAQGTELPLIGLTFVDLTLDNPIFGAPVAKRATNRYGYWLPAADLRMDVSSQVVARVSLSRTLTRAPISALDPTLTINITRPGNFAASGGNPALRPYTSDNLDLSLEWYYSKSSYLAVDLFRKHVNDFITIRSFTSPIDGVLDSSTGTLANFSISQPENEGSADITGEELSFQHLFATTGFGLIGNLTLVGTNRPFDVRRVTQTTAITGLSNSANLIAYYERGPFQARVAVNWRDRYLGQIGQSQDAYEPTFVNPYTQVDASFSCKISKKVEYYGYATNLTGSSVSSHGRFREQFLNATSSETRYVTGFRFRF
jgi:TonB-dependent receptor